jgi:hypothetical protein
MAGLLYREDMDEVRARLTQWWRGGDIGRPALLITSPRLEPLEKIPPMATPPGWSTDYSTRDFAYRVHLARTACANTCFFGEAVPFVLPDLAPNCLALFLGCHGLEQSGSVWCEPCIEDPATARFELDPSNFYWDFSWRLGEEMLRWGAGKFLTAFPDFIEGLDTLAAMRGSQEMLMDMLIDPDWVHRCLQTITERYFTCYDAFYERIRDEAGGSIYWAWAPGRMAKLQCDFSAMISPAMFGEFMVPVLRDMSRRFDHCMYHWDGPGALPHLEHLLNLPDLDMIQWTPGEGNEPPAHKRWWPNYHRILDAGKGVFLFGVSFPDDFTAMRREFGDQFGRFMMTAYAAHPAQAREWLALAEQS